jgi:hypothetical protein
VNFLRDLNFHADDPPSPPVEGRRGVRGARRGGRGARRGGRGARRGGLVAHGVNMDDPSFIR